MRYIIARKEKRVTDKMQKYVVWGAGFRGKRTVAYVDEEYRVINLLNGAPVIFFERCQKEYASYPAVIYAKYFYKEVLCHAA